MLFCEGWIIIRLILFGGGVGHWWWGEDMLNNWVSETRGLSFSFEKNRKCRQWLICSVYLSKKTKTKNRKATKESILPIITYSQFYSIKILWCSLIETITLNQFTFSWISAFWNSDWCVSFKQYAILLKFFCFMACFRSFNCPKVQPWCYFISTWKYNETHWKRLWFLKL